MRQGYYQYLLDTRQEELAARLKEEEGDHIQAINLYLKGGLPGLEPQRRGRLRQGRGCRARI